jgi:CheY-like chemotaxis protein
MTRILLVDDAELMLGIERTFLKRTGSELLTAQSGEDALLKVRRHRPDLVLLDANMHGMSGLTCCRELKADPALQGLPVVLVGSALDHDRCVEAGGDGFVAKPVTRLRLLEAVRRFLPVSERSEDRVQVAVKVDYAREGAEGLGFTRDLSSAGMFLKTRDRFEAGQMVDLTFTLPVSGGRPLRAGAEVVRGGAGGIGAAFRRLAARDRLEISRFVREHAGPEAG